MTPNQSRKLKVGDRVSFNGDQTDCGTVKTTNSRYVTIAWDDKHESLTGHDDMKRVELVKK
jgi:small-conductance mechanosensitive channel